MILETIFLWIGGLLCMGLVVVGLMWVVSWIYNHTIYHWIEAKSIVYALFSRILEKKNNTNYKQLQLKEGTEWYTRFKNKRYLWKVIKVEDIKK